MGTQQFCLRWNNHQSNMLNVFDQLLRNEAFVDVTLACEGVSVKAHKMVLSACSPYFQNLFLENPCQHPIVILKDMKYSELRAIIDFMYKGEINVSQDQLSALLKTAETLKVKGLAEVSTGNVPNSGVEVPSLDDSGVSPGGSTGPGGGSSAGGGSGGGGGGSSAGSGALSCASGSGVGVGSGSGVSMAPGSPTGDGRSSPPAKRKRHRQGRRPSNGDVSDTGERSGDQQFDAEALARLKSEPLEPAAETHVEVVMEPPSQQYDPEVPSSLERCLSEAREREISLIPRSDGITTGSTSGHGNIGQPQPSTSGTSQASQGTFVGIFARKMSNKKTRFNKNWIDPSLNPDWSIWLDQVPDDVFSAKCLACKKIFKLSNMGKQAVMSHSKFPRHLRNLQALIMAMQPGARGAEEGFPHLVRRMASKQDDLRRALDEVRSGRLTFARSAAHFGVPLSTLYVKAKTLGVYTPSRRKTRNTYVLENVQRALDDVKLGQLTFAEAAVRYGIPQSTLYWRGKLQGIRSPSYKKATVQRRVFGGSEEPAEHQQQHHDQQQLQGLPSTSGLSANSHVQILGTGPGFMLVDLPSNTMPDA